MPKRADLSKISTAATLSVTPARHAIKYGGISAGTFGASIMIFDTISQNSMIAMIIAIVVTALAFLVINYLAEYRDWKYKKQLEYEADLEKLGKDAEKPDLHFSTVYILCLVVSLVFVSVIALFTVPLLVKFFVYDPTLQAEATSYFFIAVLFVACFALVFDKLVCRPVADGYFKAQKSKVEDIVIAGMEQKLQNGTVGLSNEAQAKLLAAFNDILRNMKQ